MLTSISQARRSSHSEAVALQALRNAKGNDLCVDCEAPSKCVIMCSLLMKHNVNNQLKNHFLQIQHGRVLISGLSSVSSVLVYTGTWGLTCLASAR